MKLSARKYKNFLFENTGKSAEVRIIATITVSRWTPTAHSPEARSVYRPFQAHTAAQFCAAKDTDSLC